MKFNNIEQVNEVDAEGRTKAEIVALFPSVNADSIKLVGPLGSKHWEIEGAPLEYHLDQKNKEESNVEKVEEKDREGIDRDAAIKKWSLNKVLGGDLKSLRLEKKEWMVTYRGRDMYAWQAHSELSDEEREDSKKDNSGR